jgi:putative addiction module component (TIGR02574 family)
VFCQPYVSLTAILTPPQQTSHLRNRAVCLDWVYDSRMAKETRNQLPTEEWQLEIKRRAAELDSGAVKPVAWIEVQAELRSLLRDGE